MIALYDHIQELRAELRSCMTRRERAAVQAELARATAVEAELDRPAQAPCRSGGR
jgi:flagellar motor switch protein FliG